MLPTIIPAIIERHADEASFLWERRERAARSPLFDLPSLMEIDARLDANIEGLLVAGEDGLSACREAFERAARGREGVDGELFAWALVAAEQNNPTAFVEALVTAQKRDRSGPIVASLAWLSPPRAQSVLGELSAIGCPPALHLLAMEGYVARGDDPGALVERFMNAADPRVRSSAYRAAGMLARRDLVPLLKREIAGPDDERDPWAVWSAALLGDPGARGMLRALAEREGPVSLDAATLHARLSPDASSFVLALAKAEGGLPKALSAAEALGDPAHVPWLLEVMEQNAKHAKHALWVYASITGAALEPPIAVRRAQAPREGELAPPEDVPSDEVLERYLTDVHEDLPSPVMEPLRERWARVGSSFMPGDRRILGRGLDAGTLAELLREGPQPARASAAVELWLRGLREELFLAGAPSALQRALL